MLSTTIIILVGIIVFQMETGTTLAQTQLRIKSKSQEDHVNIIQFICLNSSSIFVLGT